MFGKKGAPMGNHNAQGHHPGHGRDIPTLGKSSRIGSFLNGAAFGPGGAMIHGAINSKNGNMVHSGSHAMGAAATQAAIGGAVYGGMLGMNAADSMAMAAPAMAIAGGSTYAFSKLGRAIGKPPNHKAYKNGR